MRVQRRARRAKNYLSAVQLPSFPNAALLKRCWIPLLALISQCFDRFYLVSAEASASANVPIGLTSTLLNPSQLAMICNSFAR
jgi:hypothetical protein